MSKLILIVGLFFCFSALAQEALLEPAWKTKGRDIVTSVIGGKWASKIFGEIPTPPAPAVALPEIPQQIKKSTDIKSYTKLSKDKTEYDRLPKERQRLFDYQFLKELFVITRKTEAKDEDLSNWLNVLEQGGSREGIYSALTLDEVYSALENIEEKPSNRLLDFSLNFSQKFFKQTFKKESLVQLNLYSLKRIFTEKGLDLLEYYEVHNLENMYLWYAVFSSDLAVNYAPLLKSGIRQDPRVEFHYEWAKSMPIQHIKSEFIIKLHMVMNGLQLLE